MPIQVPLNCYRRICIRICGTLTRNSQATCWWRWWEGTKASICICDCIQIWEERRRYKQSSQATTTPSFPCPILARWLLGIWQNQGEPKKMESVTPIQFSVSEVKSRQCHIDYGECTLCSSIDTMEDLMLAAPNALDSACYTANISWYNYLRFKILFLQTSLYFICIYIYAIFLVLYCIL